MRRLLLTLETPAANLALDEALLDQAETEGGEYLRLWESPRPIVVLGRSSRVDQEVDVGACRGRGISILRRASGGAAIVAGPGCLMYAVVLSYDRRPAAHGIRQSHTYVLERLAAAFRHHLPTVAHVGTSDLAFAADAAAAVGGSSVRKFSGNSLRVKRTHFLYHGTLLYGFDLSLISACLRTPPRQPAYRDERAHANFVVNVPLSNTEVQQCVLAAWPAKDELNDWPRARVEQLVAERYGRNEWNLG